VPNIVCTGATLQCSFGTTPATFAASGIQVETGSPVGVVTDVTPANVPPFGLCTTPSNPQVASAHTPQPCVPVLTSPWSPGSARVMVNGVNALDHSCQCLCAWGGVVTVSDAGQTAVSDQ
jgi:Domain of unknown function (DUF4280)